MTDTLTRERREELMEGLQFGLDADSRDLLTALRRLGECERDAQRYQWLRADNAYVPEDETIRGGEQLDELCDAALATEGAAP